MRIGGKNPRAEINTDRSTVRERPRETDPTSSAGEDTVMAGNKEGSCGDRGHSLLKNKFSE